MSHCKYTAQGEYKCENVNEGFVNNTCYGAPGAVCYSCVDVVNAYKNNNWRYNEKDFEQCITKANGNAPGTLGTYGNTCYNCKFGKNYLICESCLDMNNGWRPLTGLDTTNCKKASIYNDNGVLKCAKR